MEQDKFDKRFIELEVSATEKSWEYGFRDKDDIWKNIGLNPLDSLFTNLAELYLESSENQRQVLFEYCGSQTKYLENAWYFIRRIAMLIKGQENQKWLEIGIAISLMDGGRADFRDLIVSLVLLRFMAEKQGINTRPLFDIYIHSTEGSIRGILENVRDYSKSSVKLTVDTFGNPDLN